jgi:Flp pilus assembly protein TadB
VSPLLTAALVAPLAAVAALAVWRGMRPHRRSLAQVRAVLHPVSGTPTTAASISALPVEWVDRRLGAGLALAGLTAHEVVTRIALAVIGGALTVVVAVGAAVTAGTLPASPLWFALALVVGAAAGLIMWSDACGRVERCRRELRRTTTDFVQLVAVGLTTDQSVDEAVHFALGVGDSAMFDLLRDELATAPLRGVSLWEALDDLGDRYDQRELGELATSIERQGMHGVSISDTVATLATSMRERTLDDLEREADRANANLAGPTVCFVCTTIVFLAFPLAMRISEAFGG